MCLRDLLRPRCDADDITRNLGADWGLDPRGLYFPVAAHTRVVSTQSHDASHTTGKAPQFSIPHMLTPRCMRINPPSPHCLPKEFYGTSGE